MAPAEGDGASARGGGLEEEEPEGEEEDYEEAVTRHAKYLGIDPELDAAYIWIAEEVGLRTYYIQYSSKLHVQTTVRGRTSSGYRTRYDTYVHVHRRSAQPNRLYLPTAH